MDSYKQTALMFKALCDESRVKIIELLKSGERCACELLEKFNVTQPTLSHHMKVLCDSGLVTARKEGKWTHYSLSGEGLAEAEEYLHSLCESVKAAPTIHSCKSCE